MSKTDGPSVALKLSCFDCKHESGESYAVQGDSGHDVYCNHPEVGKKRIGDSRWDTPEWCPLRKIAIAQFMFDSGYADVIANKDIAIWRHS